MAGTDSPLLCELHAHTTWSDGALSMPALVDLYGSAGFDVLAITDHVLRCGSRGRRSVHAANHGAYLAEIERLDHLATWKTLVPCARAEEAILEHLRSPRPVDLTRLDRTASVAELAA